MIFNHKTAFRSAKRKKRALAKKRTQRGNNIIPMSSSRLTHSLSLSSRGLMSFLTMFTMPLNISMLYISEFFVYFWRQDRFVFASHSAVLFIFTPLAPPSTFSRSLSCSYSNRSLLFSSFLRKFLRCQCRCISLLNTENAIQSQFQCMCFFFV